MRQLVPFVLLAFTAGGVVAPAVHRVVHANEAGAERRAHNAAGHHHHADWQSHGVEWTVPCDRPVELDELACVLCKGLSSADTPAQPAAPALPQDDRAVVVQQPLVGCAEAGPALARGPPHRIA